MLFTWKQEGNDSQTKWGYLPGNRKGMTAENNGVMLFTWKQDGNDSRKKSGVMYMETGREWQQKKVGLFTWKQEGNGSRKKVGLFTRK